MQCLAPFSSTQSPSDNDMHEAQLCYFTTSCMPFHNWWDKLQIPIRHTSSGDKARSAEVDLETYRHIGPHPPPGLAPPLTCVPLRTLTCRNQPLQAIDPSGLDGAFMVASVDQTCHETHARGRAYPDLGPSRPPRVRACAHVALTQPYCWLNRHRRQDAARRAHALRLCWSLPRDGRPCGGLCLRQPCAARQHP